MILTAVSVIRTIWPFLKEVFFPGKSILEVMRANKFVVFLLVLLALSLCLNYLAIEKLLKLQGVTITPPTLNLPPKVGHAPVKEVPTASQPTVSAIPEQLSDQQIQEHLDQITNDLKQLQDNAKKSP